MLARKTLRLNSVQLKTIARSLSSVPSPFATLPEKQHATEQFKEYLTTTYINNSHLKSDSKEWFKVYDPATNKVITQVPQSTDAELDSAIQAAADAFELFKEVSIIKRLDLVFNYIEILKKNKEKLASLIVLEQGKAYSDAIADVIRGIQCAEHATTVVKETEGVSLEISNGIESKVIREPIGVTGSIMPFNFPVMIMLWTIPYIIATGNTTVIKPSELCPGSGALLAELAAEAGVPKGVINIVHGKHATVEKLSTDPRISAVTFVGGNNAGKAVYANATKHHKRVKVNLGAKNHVVVLPDVEKDVLLKGIVSGAFSSTGQVCLSTDVLFLVKEANRFIPDIIERVKALKVRPGFEDGDFGPVVTKESLQRLHDIIEDAEAKGAEILVDGRNPEVPGGYENGYFIGATLLKGIRPGMRAYDEELFGPIFGIVEVETLDHTIDIINKNPFGNSVAIFTRDGVAANKFVKKINIGQVGINSSIPIGIAQHGFTSNKASFLGDLHFYGPSAFKFFTQPKTVITSWRGYSEN
ncbi:hypothetical protein WICMUC_001243 [Wickerhamomyces mucosus]|uniref:Aldehyde dehydrogenase domain-containing protein n=1 Tax=Wickerhamomyces mucosus TaxID=1378264 RepID=A0A9P8PV94_9ASCO|nr:hypothetical protein WICMUC_001243 [Wickerhamomyces mucosus]